MRKILDFNQDWLFIRTVENAEAVKFASGVQVKLPHTWNAEDGQDGGNDYHRGTCWYKKTFAGPERKSDERVWLEFGAVAMTADVYMNDRHLAHHEGGYSIFRVDITDTLDDDNVLVVSADNSKNETVYPQKADFTFYGGIYRDVKLIIVPAVHFSLDYNGSPAIKITPKVDGTTAEVKVETWVSGNVKAGSIIEVEIETAGQKKTVPVEKGYASANFTISNVHLWDGLDDPYLYTARAKIVASGDMIETKYGCRSFEIDPEQGFFLNGRSYPLCGAARHQDRQGVGYAVTREMMEVDMRIMLEMGANTVRLAHYQHDQYYYDLCDQYGMIAWVEIPYITQHMPSARANTISQMTELVVQSYNHPSIICWDCRTRSQRPAVSMMILSTIIASSTISAISLIRPDRPSWHMLLCLKLMILW